MQVDFYILTTKTQNERLLFACRLIEKVLLKHERILVLCEDSLMLEQLDGLLWSYKETSFIDHLPIDKMDQSIMPRVLLTTNKIEELDEHFVMVKLQNEFLDKEWNEAHLFRVLEIVDEDQTVLESSRANFKDYKARGFDINVHKMN